jgi:hypothetical protein
MSVEIKKDITTVQIEVPKTNLAVENAVTEITVQTSQPLVTISQVGIKGKDGETQDLSSLNDFTASYYIDSASIVNLIQQATNEQDLSNYALLSGSNHFTGSQFISGSVTISNRLNFFTGSFINSQIQIEAFLTNYTLLEIVNYSSSSFDDLEASAYNLTNGVPAPWAAFRLAAAGPIPVTSIEVNDILAGTSIIPSTVQAKGGTGFTDVMVVDLDLTGLTQILPLTGSIFQLLRPLVKPSLSIETPNGTDIFLNSQGLGDTIANTNIVPLVTAQNKLGLPTRRWKEIWVASGSIYMQDETLGIDLRMTARDGNFVVDGAAGLKVGEFTLRDNRILLSNPNRDIIIGQEIASGSVVFNRPLQVNTFAGSGSFLVDKSGRTQLIVPNIPAGDIGAFSIIGNPNGAYQPVINPSGMVHVTGNDGQAARVTVDGFGSSIGAIFVGRHARGTAALPTPTLSGDVLARFSGLGYSTSSYFPIVGGVPTSLEFQATENYSTSGAGSRAAFYTYANGATNRTLSAIVDTDGLVLPNVPTNETADKVLVWDSVTGRIGKQSGISTIDGGAAASIFILSTEVLNGGGA